MQEELILYHFIHVQNMVHAHLFLGGLWRLGVGCFRGLSSVSGGWKRDMAAVCNLLSLASPTAYLSQNSMARRTRSSRAWHFVLSGVRREADTRAVALATGARGWGYDSDGQVGLAGTRVALKRHERKAVLSPDSGHFLKVRVTEQLVLQHAQLASI